MSAKELRIYTVTQINSLVKFIIEEHMPSRLTIRGEISDWKAYSSGHRYFLLKDEGGTLPCTMWASNANRVKFKPENGLEVIATGHIDVYVPGGKYQFYVEKMDPAGVGALQLAFEQLKAKLQADGLFDDKHKKPLPKFPMRIGIITSAQGAAVEDIKTSILHRWPCAKLFLYPAPVQGEGAAEKIADAINHINRINKDLRLEVLIVGRGGGSLEDLWEFNREVLARAIFASKIPVISAVGHEIDFTIADFVADIRASTPTKAGVAAVPDIREIMTQLNYFSGTFYRHLRSQLDYCSSNIKTAAASVLFRNPLSLVQNKAQQADELQNHLTSSVRSGISKSSKLLHLCYDRLIRIEPHRLMGVKLVDLANLESRAAKALSGRFQNAERMLTEGKNMSSNAMQRRLHKTLVQLTAAENRLAGLDPKSVLQRGYSITINPKTGRLVRTPDDIEIGQPLSTELADKKFIESKVTNK